MGYTINQFKQDIKNKLCIISAYQTDQYIIGYNVYSKKIGVELKKEFLPWIHCKIDMNFFKEKTTNQIVVMGRKTFNSMNNKPLPNRINIIMTSNTELENTENLYFVNDLEQLRDVIFKYTEKEVYFIGGAMIYDKFLKICDFVYLNEINKNWRKNPEINKFVDENPNLGLVKNPIKFRKVLRDRLTTDFVLSNINEENPEVKFFTFKNIYKQ